MRKRKKVGKSSRPANNSDEVRKFAELAKKIPEVRQEKVNAVKKQIETGTYNVPAEHVAESIISHQKEIKKHHR